MASPAGNNDDEKPKRRPLQYEGIHWNPMAILGEQLLTWWGASPRVLWCVLQLGGLLGAYILIRCVGTVATIFALMFEFAGMDIRTVRGLIAIGFLVTFFVSTHLLWRNMVHESKRRLRDEFVLEGKHAKHFERDPRAQLERQEFQERLAESRRRKNRMRRPSHRKRASNKAADQKKDE